MIVELYAAPPPFLLSTYPPIFFPFTDKIMTFENNFYPGYRQSYLVMRKLLKFVIWTKSKGIILMH